MFSVQQICREFPACSPEAKVANPVRSPGCSIRSVTRHLPLPENTLQPSLTEIRPGVNRKFESLVNFQNAAPRKIPPPSLGAGPLQVTIQTGVLTYSPEGSSIP